MDGVEPRGSAALTEFRLFWASSHSGQHSLPFALIVHENPIIIYFGRGSAS